MLCIAIIGDMIDSKKIENRELAQKKLKYILEEVNIRHQEIILSNFTITIGDEFQGLLKISSSVFQIIDYIKNEFKLSALRFGIGVGEITTAINPRQSIGADGPAYWNARKAINYIHDNDDYGTSTIAFESGHSNFDQSITIQLALTEFIKSRWVFSQQETFQAILDLNIYQERFDQSVVAKSMNLSDSAFTKRLKSSGIKLYLRTMNHLAAQLVSFFANEEEKNT